MPHAGSPLPVFGLMARTVHLVIELGVGNVGASRPLAHEFLQVGEIGRIDVARSALRFMQTEAAMPTTSPIMPQVRMTRVEPSAMCVTEMLRPAMNMLRTSFE